MITFYSVLYFFFCRNAHGASANSFSSQRLYLGLLLLIYLISLLSFIFNFIIMESLSDIDWGLVVLFIKLLSYFLLGFQFLILA